jgi:hypothetical protein
MLHCLATPLERACTAIHSFLPEPRRFCGAANPGCSRLVCDSLSSTLFFNAARFTLNGKEIRPPVPLGVTDLFNPALPVAELSGGFRTKQIFD